MQLGVQLPGAGEQVALLSGMGDDVVEDDEPLHALRAVQQRDVKLHPGHLGSHRRVAGGMPPALEIEPHRRILLERDPAQQADVVEQVAAIHLLGCMDLEIERIVVQGYNGRLNNIEIFR